MSDDTTKADSLPVPANPSRPAPLAVKGDEPFSEPKPRTRGPMLLGFAAMALFVGSFGGWSLTAPLAEAAIAPGMIKVEGTRRTIQHLEGGMVRDILARDGDRVTAGQVIMRLDDVQAIANREALRNEFWTLLAQNSRLMAELARAREIVFPQDLLNSNQPRAADAIAVQRSVFESRTTNLESQIQVLRNRIEQQNAVAEATRQQLRSQVTQIDLLRQEEVVVQGLVRQGLERMPRLLGIQRSVAASEGNIGDYRAQLERTEGAIAEARSQMKQIEDQRLQEVAAELRDARARLAEVEERLRAAEDVATRRDIIAPEDGTILNSRVFTIGAVVRPGDPLMDLVPVRDRLVAEVNLQPYDIDVVYAGLQAEVRLPAFKQRLVPYLHGHVTFVASDITIDERLGHNHYKVRITIDEDQLRALQGVQLQPGMPVEAMIITGRRSFARYMVQPILDSFTRAFREQ